MDSSPLFNTHNKEEYPPMHTVEHLINRTADLMWACGRSHSAHIERRKSKMDFRLSTAPMDEEIHELERRVNAIIAQDLPVRYEVITQQDAGDRGLDLGRIPDQASEAVRVVSIGDYDTCLCIGSHVSHTSQCGQLRITSHSYDKGTLRLRFKLDHVSEDFL